MKLSFDDEESFKGAVGSLYLNNVLSDSYTLQQMGSMPPQHSRADSERSEDIYFNNYPL